MKVFFSRQFLTFILTGGTAALVNFISRIALNFWLDFMTAVVLAYLIGMATAFSLARIFVFQNSSAPLGRSIAIFALVNVAAICQTLAISGVLFYYILPYFKVHQFSAEIAHAVGIIVPVFSSYVGHKYWSFK